MKIRKGLTLSIEEDLYQKFKLLANSDGRSPCNMVLLIITRMVAVYEEAFGKIDLLTGIERR